jgi:hypothetical protein
MKVAHQEARDLFPRSAMHKKSIECEGKSLRQTER